jgi:hypothetical protein
VDDDEHEKHLRDALAQIKKQTDESIAQMSNGMMEAMGPMLSGIALLQDEAKAWDSYVVAFVRSFVAVPEDTDVEVRAHAVAQADFVLAARRGRFNEEQLKERMRGILPSGRGLCNKPVIVNGKDMGMRCARSVDHYPVGGCY